MRSPCPRAWAGSALPLEALLRLAGDGARSAQRLARLGGGDGDVRARALRAGPHHPRRPPTAWRSAPRSDRLARHLPGLREWMASMGPRGAFARGPLVHLLGDRSWIVRTAAALGLGECRDAQLAAPLRARLEDSSRPVRIAAAAALTACGCPPSRAPLCWTERTRRPSGWGTPKIHGSGWSAAWRRTRRWRRGWATIPAAEKPDTDSAQLLGAPSLG